MPAPTPQIVEVPHGIPPTSREAKERTPKEIRRAYDLAFLEAPKYERIFSTLEINQLERTPLSNTPWQICYLAGDAIEPVHSDWAQVASAPGICILGRRFDHFYEVLINDSYFPWLRRHNFEFFNKAQFEALCCHDPILPSRIELDVYGWATFYTRFIKNASKAIRERQNKGLELCLRSIAPDYLRPALEWAILRRDIKVSGEPVQKQFVLFLVLLALLPRRDYKAPSVLQLLDTDQKQVLRALWRDLADLFKGTESRDGEEAIRLIELLRRVFVVAGGQEDAHQLQLVQGHTAHDVFSLIGSLFGITGSNCIRRLDLGAILSAVLESDAFCNDYPDPLDITKSIIHLLKLLEAGVESNLGPPNIFPTIIQLGGPQGVGIMGDLDKTLVRLGGVMTGSTSLTVEDVQRRLSSSLHDKRMMTIVAHNDGSYGEQGNIQYLSSEVLRVIRMMITGQKVLFVERVGSSNECCIWVIELLRVMSNIDRTPPPRKEKPESVKRSFRQRFRSKPRVKFGKCGLWHVFSAACRKFLGK